MINAVATAMAGSRIARSLLTIPAILASIRSSTLAKRWFLTQSASAISVLMTCFMILPDGLRGIGRTIRSWGTL